MRRTLAALALILASSLLHLLLLAWLGGRLDAPGAADARQTAPVEIALLSRPPPAPLPEAAKPPAPTDRPKKARTAPKPVPRPAAISEPAANVAARAATAVEPMADSVLPPAADGDAAVAQGATEDGADAQEGAQAGAQANAQAEAQAPQASAEQAASGPSESAADGITSPRYGRPLPLPPAGRWTFGVYYGDYTERHRVASLEYAIAHDGRSYRLSTQGRAEGLTALLYSGVLSQTSAGRLSDNGLEPERYTEQRGKRAERWAAVDYSTRQVSFSGNAPVPLVAGAQDRLSALVQIGLLARALPERFTSGSVVEIPELTLRDVEHAKYASRGDAALETDDGSIRALHLERVAPRADRDAKIEVWLGYDHGMLPVRIRLTDPGGRVLDQLLVQP